MRTSPITPLSDAIAGDASPFPNAFAIHRHRYRPFLLAMILGTAALSAASVVVFRQAGAWLIVQAPLAPAHAIVVLSGSMPSRAREAAKIYQQSFSAQVWISPGLPPTRELEALGIAYVGESFYNQRVLMALGVPSNAIRILATPAANTEEEVEEIARECRQEGAHNVILVTSKAHTRRVRFIWHRLVGNDPGLIVRYASGDPFDAAHWWRTTSDALVVVRELLGLVNAVLGFPSRPEPH
jgi:uncharacterized SAM-binding protein YcdF (DUF218 family)